MTFVARLHYMGPCRVLAAHPVQADPAAAATAPGQAAACAQHNACAQVCADLRRAVRWHALPGRGCAAPASLQGVPRRHCATRFGECAPYVGSLERVFAQARRSCWLQIATLPQRAACMSLFAAVVPARRSLRELRSVRTSSTAARAPSTRPTRLAAQGCARRGGRGPGGHVPVLPGGPDIQRAA